jgi:hypothetical protein
MRSISARALAAALALTAGGSALAFTTTTPASAASKPATSAKAVTAAKKKKKRSSFSGQCEKWVRMQFGAKSGFPTAMANWRDAVRKGMAHRGDRNPPKGVLVFWNVANGKGHVGISVGGGRFRDYRGTHAISSMKNYLGWAPERYN